MKFAATTPLKRSYWMNQAEPGVKPENVHKGSYEADVTIVGGGFVGIWTALRIKELEPAAKVLLLEQDVCGGGASGRNGGFVMSWWPKIQSLRAFCPDADALFLCQESERAIGEIGSFCAEFGIAADFTQKGWLWTATCKAHIDGWESTVRACESLGFTPFTRMTREELVSRTGSDRHLAGVFEKSIATVQPAALARGMRRVALQSGIEIREGTQVTEIVPGAQVTLRTPSGTVRSKSVVLATNAWASALPEIRKQIATVNSSLVVTNPIPGVLKKIGWDNGEAITDSQLLVDYYRTTSDGRIAFGKGTGAITYGSKVDSTYSDHPESVDQTTADFFKTYPSLSDVSLIDHWSGPIDRSYDSLPVFGHLKGQPNIFYGVGWSGNGVGPSKLGGKILASLALNIKDQWSTCALVERSCKSFPPEPFRYIGGNIVRNAVIRKERAELSGNKGRTIDSIIASLAPAGLEDKG